MPSNWSTDIASAPTDTHLCVIGKGFTGYAVKDTTDQWWSIDAYGGSTPIKPPARWARPNSRRE